MCELSWLRPPSRHCWWRSSSFGLTSRNSPSKFKSPNESDKSRQRKNPNIKGTIYQTMAGQNPTHQLSRSRMPLYFTLGSQSSRRIAAILVILRGDGHCAQRSPYGCTKLTFSHWIATVFVLHVTTISVEHGLESRNGSYLFLTWGLVQTNQEAHVYFIIFLGRARCDDLTTTPFRRCLLKQGQIATDIVIAIGRRGFVDLPYLSLSVCIRGSELPAGLDSRYRSQFGLQPVSRGNSDARSTELKSNFYELLSYVQVL